MAGTYYNALMTFNTKTTGYTLSLTDQTKDTIVEMNVGSANTLIVPANTNVPFPVGSQILISQYGSGQTTISGDTGVTINSSGGKTKIAAQYGLATLIKRGADEWYLAGDITT